MQGEDRRFIHTFGANREFSAADIPLELLDEVKVLYLGGYLAMPGVKQDDLVPVFAAARAKGVKTVLDIVLPAKENYLARLDRLLPHVDVFLPNNFEGEIITGYKDPLQQAAVFQRLARAPPSSRWGPTAPFWCGQTCDSHRNLRGALRRWLRRRRRLRRRLHYRPVTPAPARKIACASPAPWVQAASAPSAPPPASSPAPNAKRSCAKMRCRCNGSKTPSWGRLPACRVFQWQAGSLPHGSGKRRQCQKKRAPLDVWHANPLAFFVPPRNNGPRALCEETSCD